MSTKELAKKIYQKLKCNDATLVQVETVLNIIRDDFLDETSTVLLKERYDKMKQLEQTLRNSGM